MITDAQIADWLQQMAGTEITDDQYQMICLRAKVWCRTPPDPRPSIDCCGAPLTLPIFRMARDKFGVFAKAYASPAQIAAWETLADYLGHSKYPTAEIQRQREYWLGDRIHPNTEIPDDVIIFAGLMDGLEIGRIKNLCVPMAYSGRIAP